MSNAEVYTRNGPLNSLLNKKKEKNPQALENLGNDGNGLGKSGLKKK